ncbi:MAG: SGNH/GDSL hydrolase family protein [Ferruginibacter sp.]
MISCSYLALGDSYTIGEQVLLAENFPYQAVQLLRRNNNKFDFTAPEIIAKTGWTTDELAAAIAETKFLPKYDFVSLLIGVNNQYRGRPVENYKQEFEGLLQKAIQFAGNDRNRVFVLSIPDWGITPFAAGRDNNVIAKEIDAFNAACKLITESMHCHFIDITADQRADNNKEGFIATDGLHPSGKEYAKWAKKLSDAVLANL